MNWKTQESFKNFDFTQLCKAGEGAPSLKSHLDKCNNRDGEKKAHGVPRVGLKDYLLFIILMWISSSCFISVWSPFALSLSSLSSLLKIEDSSFLGIRVGGNGIVLFSAKRPRFWKGHFKKRYSVSVCHLPLSPCVNHTYTACNHCRFHFKALHWCCTVW